MQINIQKDGDTAVLSIIGTLDVNSSIELDNQIDKIIQQGFTSIAVDCSELDYVTSPGIGVFTSRVAELEQKKISLVLYDMNEKVYGVFKVLGLDVLIPLHKK
jgi:anti-sigma B factor antagonist